MINVEIDQEPTDVSMIYLRLGLKCNSRCKYCFYDRNSVDNHKESLEINSDIFKYINESGAKYEKNNSHLDERFVVMFWGGEPLLYFDTIKNIIDKFDTNVCNFRVITNGYSLSEEMVEFFNKYRVNVGISNDGPCSSMLRGRNVLEEDDKVNLIKKINNPWINVTLHRYNQNLSETWKYINDKVGENISIHSEILYPSVTAKEDMFDYDWNIFSRENKLFAEKAAESINKGFTGDRHRYYLGNTLIDVLVAITRGGTYALGQAPCCQQMYSKKLSIDLQGNLYSCHNQLDIVGNVHSTREELINTYWKTHDKNERREPKCTSCKYKLICRGLCPYRDRTKSKKCYDNFCKAKKIRFDGVLDFLELTGYPNVREILQLK